MRRCGIAERMIGQAPLEKGGWMAAWPTSRTFQVANADESIDKSSIQTIYYTSSPVFYTQESKMAPSNEQTIPSRPAKQTEAAHPKTDAAHPTDTAAAQHALEHTNSWTPKLDRRQSWSKEDQKRALQMTGIADGESKNGA
ncbi:unnamed protein product [Clonostachys rosea]|uniref:Uncharacterized protein n=1 Tax=Bionectria ochroleuca TaxID=29856 RepID=A0ABY6TSW6_BIOOC|nr:unnamed protein product [Clonostachys rosea]